METRILHIRDNEITLLLPEEKTASAVYVFSDHSALEEISHAVPSAVLIAISGNDWEKDFTPYPHARVFHGGSDFTGGADRYLSILTEEILPFAEKEIPYPITQRILAGYSLAGLFSVYAFLKTDVFEDFCCASGSLWYPGFLDYLSSHPLKRIPKKAYFSLGDKESETKNPYLSKADEAMKATEAFFAAKGSLTVYEKNAGGHFADSEKRLAQGITWLLEDSGSARERG
jgi:predicted alpha/beta superfamily hydrolase